MTFPFADTSAASCLPVHIVRPADITTVLDGLSDAQKTYALACGFSGSAGDVVILSSGTGEIAGALMGAGEADPCGQDVFLTGLLPQKLPKGDYEIVSAPTEFKPHLMALAWGLGAYKFTAYLDRAEPGASLKLADDMRPDETRMMIAAIESGRDLVNMPAGDLGPVALHHVAATLADSYGASFEAIVGDDLLDKNYPMIHAVGRAAHEAPRLLHLRWGKDSDPHLALVGKGITYDTGGLNIKGGAGMRYMKKDMGGAAHALTLARMIMAANLPIRLDVFLSVAENAVSAGAYRPGDILESRAGITVEIDNTDAEGRLVLADALCRAAELDPALIMNFATLTGAARVALGPTLPPFYSNRKDLVAPIVEASDAESDPLWPMPLWQPYNRYLDSPIANMKNAGGRYAGSVTAALFLERFVDSKPWMHFDVFAWNPSTAPSRPVGGEIHVLRALYAWLKSGGLSS